MGVAILHSLEEERQGGTIRGGMSAGEEAWNGGLQPFAPICNDG